MLRNKGFTLVELLIVITIIAVLASLVLVSLGLAGARARVAVAKTQIRNLEIALSLYKDDVGFYPPGDVENDTGIINVVEALSGRPKSEGGGGGPGTPYWPFKEKELSASKFDPSRQVFLDPWRNPWRYTRATDDMGVLKEKIHSKSSYDLYSCGPDGTDHNGENNRNEGKDDVNNWSGD